MQLFLSILSLVAGIFLVRSTTTKNCNLTDAIWRLYIGIAIIFGSIYYLIYRYDNTSFTFSDEIARDNKVLSIVNNAEDLDRKLSDLHQYDSLAIAYRNTIVCLQELSGNKPFKLSDEWDFTLTESQIFMKIDAKGPSFPVRIQTFKAKSPDFKDISFTLQEKKLANSHLELVSRIDDKRRDLASEVKKLRFGGERDFRFNLFDFYYFSFTITGAADISASKTWIRLLTLMQLGALGGLLLHVRTNVQNKQE